MSKNLQYFDNKGKELGRVYLVYGIIDENEFIDSYTQNKLASNIDSNIALIDTYMKYEMEAHTILGFLRHSYFAALVTLTEEFRTYLETEYSVTTETRRNRLWELSWEQGASGGCYEVDFCYKNLASSKTKDWRDCVIE